MPIFAGRVAVALDVSDNLGVGLRSRIETKGSLNLVILEVTIDSFGATNNLYAIFLGSIVFSKHAGIGIGVITTDDHDGLNIELADNLQTFFKLIFFLKFCTS